MTLLVTGGTGLVGKAIKSVFENDSVGDVYFASSTKDGDLSIWENCEKLFRKTKPKYVIHLAANVGGLYKNMTRNVEMFESNLQINYNVVKCCHLFEVLKSIHCLSTCVFPDQHVEYPLTESQLHNGPPHQSNEGYAYAKRMLELHTRLYNQTYESPRMICIAPVNIYGPHDNFHLENSHVIPALIHKAYIAAKTGTKFVVRGSGKPLRQFLYSEDLARILLTLIFDWNPRSLDDDTFFIVADSGTDVSIESIARVVAKQFRLNNDNIHFDTTFADGQFRKLASNAKLLSIFTNITFTGIEEGLSKTIEWFKQNYPDHVRM